MGDIRASPRKLHFGLRLYPDSTTYDCQSILDGLGEYFDKFAYILHDRDVDENGEKLKPHYHVYCKRSSASTCEAVAHKLGLNPQDVEIIRSVKGNIRYLVHADNADKYQYNYEEVITNFDILPILDEATEAKRVLQIIDYVTSERTNSTLSVALYALEANCWSEFRRSYSIIKDIMNEVRI